ncbi:MAG: flagellar biosynthesis protein FliA [Actinomycetota bacterium]
MRERPRPSPELNIAQIGEPPAGDAPAVDETAEPAVTPRARRPVIFGGVLEADGWARAPLRTFDLVHFRLNRPLPIDELREHLDISLDDTVSLTLDTDDLYRAFVSPGKGPLAAGLISRWCEERSYLTTGLRTDLNRRRRNISDLDRQYLADLMTHYQGYGMRRLQKNMSSVLLHIPEYDDVQQQLAVWILEAIVRFDDTKGVPFGAWLSTALSKWVHDLNRSSFGRTVADAELKQHRAVAAFTATEHRHPNETELAGLIGTSVTALRRSRQSVSVVNGLRACLSIESGGLDDTELSIPARGNDPAEQLEEDVRPVIVSSVLTNACAADPAAKLPSAREVNTIGWVTWYATMYRGETRTELSEELRTSMRNLHVHSERASGVMAARMPEAMGNNR